MSAHLKDLSRGTRALRMNELIAWLLLLFSATFFVLSAIRAGDTLGLVGALLFLIICIVFLVPSLFIHRSD